jgi:transcriptional regulator with XRE-family HTH domain
LPETFGQKVAILYNPGMAETDKDFPLRELGLAIATARRTAGLTQQELGDLVDRSGRTINRYEKDPPPIMLERDLAAIAEAVGSSSADLVDRAYEIAGLEPPPTSQPRGDERLVQMIRELQGGQADLMGRLGQLEDLLKDAKKSEQPRDSRDPKQNNH